MIKRIFSFAFLLLFMTQLNAQDKKQTLFDYFYAQKETPVIHIDTDLKKLIRKKHAEEYQESEISFDLENGERMIFESKLRARGNIRKSVCLNPPLKLNFKEKDLEKIGFDSLDILKTVMQCNNSDRTINYISKERLAYDLYAVIDTLAMRAKVVQFEMYNDGEHKESMAGFLIETEKHYARRTAALVAESGTLRSSVLQRSHFLKMSFFQYMIGNVDYAIRNKHNVEILQLQDKRLVAIPYDFDYSGLVNTEYAVPHESLPIKTVRDRLFMAKNVTIEEAVATVSYYESIKDELFAVIENAEYLSDRDKKDASQYIKDFYDTISNPKRIGREFVK